ncbi:MAG: HAD family hydrolase [Bdellovibrionota bacterium]
MFKVIAFDLDDTLIDTSGTLIPNALKTVHKVLQSKGYKLGFEEFNQRRLSMTHSHSHKEIFDVLVKELNLNPSEQKETLDKCVSAFYEPAVPATLPLLEGADDLLPLLKEKYKLYLVSSGSVAGQTSKIKAAGVEHFFEEVLIVPTPDHTGKKEAFSWILANEKIGAYELLSVGNRLSNEIRCAKELGAATCYLQYGEHAHETPQNKMEEPDFHIFSLKEITDKCQL